MTGKSELMRAFAHFNSLPLVDLKLSPLWSELMEPAPIIQQEPRPIRKELCFRVETLEGLGMYQTEYRNDLNGNSQVEDHYRHPPPYNDYALNWAPLRDKDHYYFGFASLEQLRRWIHSEHLINKLKEYDLAVSIYQTDDFSIGDTQMVFRKSTAQLVGRFDL